jgi:heme-degrading monooxygenase HmoA
MGSESDRPTRARVPGELFVVVSQFEVANGLEDAVEAAFVARPHLVDSAPGFVRLEVIRGVENPRAFWLLTYWEEEASYRGWHKGHAYHASHLGIPKHLKLKSGSVAVHFLRSIRV